ncbi:DUF2787 family protein [Rheinheimera mangrovi]|uniref:DUF2787 family protein n=1 Tax=Rheinheimera mangrovi TaxID=2498451 RepID=UPI000F8DF0D5|nr:DUF2787 family protein [Rheinheimera mangrovi]
MNINTTNLPLAVSDKLTDLIKEALKGKDLTNKTSVTLNFRDPDYSAEKGGYHPVEIMLKRKGDEWHMLYITDFCYADIGPYAELVKDLDFDFGAGVFQTLYGYYRIEEALDIYPVWEQNFCCYRSEFDVYTCQVSA